MLSKYNFIFKTRVAKRIEPKINAYDKFSFLEASLLKSLIRS